MAEFLDWDSGDHSGRHWQLVDGEPLPMAVGHVDHGAMLAELGTLIGNHLARRDVWRAAMFLSVVPRLAAHRNLRIADLGVISMPARDGIAAGDPVLLADIISPNSHAETRGNI